MITVKSRPRKSAAEKSSAISISSTTVFLTTPSLTYKTKVTFVITLLSLLLTILLPFPVTAQQPQSTSETPSLFTSPSPTPATQLPLNHSSLNTHSQSLSVQPSRLGDDYSLTLLPNSQTTIIVQLTNPTDQPISVLTTAQDFIVGGDDGETPILLTNLTTNPTTNRWSMADWLTIAGSLNHLEPFETITLPVLISVPEKARSGGHYAMLVHQIIDPNNPSALTSAPSDLATNPTPSSVGLQTQSRIITQLGQMLYVIVPGDNLTENLEIIDFSFDSLRETGPIHYDFSIKNASDYHTHPVGEITVTNFIGQPVATFPIDSDQNMFPETTRQYEGAWDRSWGFGPYTATLNLVYGPNQTLLTAQTSFWLLPVRFIILVLLIIACLFVVSYNGYYKKIRQAKENTPHVKK